MKKKNLATVSVVLLASIISLAISLAGHNFPLYAQTTTDNLAELESGVFATGDLAYVSGGKDLGSESYELTKLNSGEIKLTSEGVVTPPIPIPFVKPKIKFNQEIIVRSDLSPKDLMLDYNGPLGIGSSKIRATVSDGLVDADLGGKEKSAQLNSSAAFFQGTGSSSALTTLILASLNGSDKLTEIRTGGTGPQSGDEDRLLVNLELARKETQELKINGSLETVNRYVLNDPGSSVDKVILSREGTFIAYLRLGGENSFYVYRTDLLGEDYKFSSIEGQN